MTFSGLKLVKSLAKSHDLPLCMGSHGNAYVILETMIKSARPLGYTVIEIMIFLAVSGALLVPTLAAVGGQQAKTEFSQSARDVESRIRDIINDVSTGYYPNTGNIRCTLHSSGAGIVLTKSPTDQGKNQDCIFIGRVIQFAPAGSDEDRRWNVYTVAGQRLVSASPKRETGSIVEAKGQAIAKTSTGDIKTPDVTEETILGPIKLSRVAYDTGSGVQDTAAVGIFTTFANYTAFTLDSGSTTADLIPIHSGGTIYLGQGRYDFTKRLNKKLASDAASLPINPSKGVQICIERADGSEYAILEIGGEGRQLTTQLTFHDTSSSGVCAWKS